MEGKLAIFALIWWVFAIINIVACVKAGKRYKKLGEKGAVKRIVLSWVIFLSGIIVGSIFSTIINSRDPMTTVAVTFCTTYLFGIIAIIYTGKGASGTEYGSEEKTEKSLQDTSDGRNIDKAATQATNDSIRGVLYVRFNIDAVEGGAYGMACYKTVFANVPVHALQNCTVSMGDSNATLAGRENVCIIGLTGPVGQLRTVMDALKGSTAFTSVCAGNPLVLNGAPEPLVADGTYTEDGSLLSSWAKAAFNAVNKNN
jgi:hypothetical protein